MALLSKYRSKVRLGFPLSRPIWPTEVPRSIPKSKLGANFKTEWSRRPPARLARALITDFVTKPAIAVLASPTVTGVDRISHLDSPVIFAANHASHLDTPLLLASLPEHFRHKTAVGAGADYFFDKTWKAYLWSFLLAAIPIERTKVSRRSNELALAVIAEGWNLVIFPEGGRTPDGFAREFKGGVAQLAVKTNTTVVPVYIGGTYEIYGKNSSRIRPGKTAVNFGHPLSPQGKEARGFVREIQVAVEHLADEVHSDYWSAQKRRGAGDTPSLESPKVNSWIADWNRPRIKSALPHSKGRWPRLPVLNKPFR